MKLPRTDIGTFAKDLIDECCVSRRQRADLIRMWKSYYFTGTPDGNQAEYNRCFSHTDRLASYLFSPADVRFTIEFDESEPDDVHARGDAASRHLNREYHRTNCDITFASAVNLALIKGCCLTKKLWGFDGLESWIVHPEYFGVLNESIGELDRQEAFVETTYITKNHLRRTLIGHIDQETIMRKVERQGEASPEEINAMGDFFHQVIIGGQNPIGIPGTANPTQGSSSGTVGVIGVPQPMIDPEVAKRLVRLDELWVIDSDRDDYVTVRMVNSDPTMITEGKGIKRNLNGLYDYNRDKVPDDMRGFHPYAKVCPNEIEGYFWGMSELAQIYKLQNSLNNQLADINRMMGLASDPPRGLIGFTGITPEKYKALKRKGGFASEENPNAKIEDLSPKIPDQLFSRLEKTIEMFDEIAGFMPIMQGQSEPGVRAGSHAQTLARNASPRMRDRALLVERQCVEDGDFCLKMEQAKNAELIGYVGADDKPASFVLKQLPDNARVTVDSHTASPAFMEDAEKKAFALKKMGAIDDEDLIMLTHPPHEDTLAMKARKRAKAAAAFAEKHPEIAAKAKGHK